MISRNLMRLTARFFLFVLMVVIAAPDRAMAEMTDLPKVRLRSLDKTTARTMTFDARVGTTIKFGSIYIKIQACRKPDLQELPEAAAFLQVWEITPADQSKWIFSGWMFASSPALSAMDHPIYDVWVIDCLDDVVKKPVAEQAAKEAEVKEDAPAEESSTPAPTSAPAPVTEAAPATATPETPAEKTTPESSAPIMGDDIPAGSEVLPDQ